MKKHTESHLTFQTLYFHINLTFILSWTSPVFLYFNCSTFRWSFPWETTHIHIKLWNFSNAQTPFPEEIKSQFWGKIFREKIWGKSFEPFSLLFLHASTQKKQSLSQRQKKLWKFIFNAFRWETVLIFLEKKLFSTALCTIKWYRSGPEEGTKSYDNESHEIEGKGHENVSICTYNPPLILINNLLLHTQFFLSFNKFSRKKISFTRKMSNVVLSLALDGEFSP